MHKFAVVHKLSGIVCYSTNREIRFEPGFNYEIVNNSNEYKTVTPNLNFDNYSEIANALDLSDVLVFTKDSDDTLTISDNTRSVSIPSLLFEETILDVEESVFGDVCEILEDFGFNRDSTELLAHNAVKFWAAVRFLDTTETTETTETTPTIGSKEMNNVNNVNNVNTVFKKATTLPLVISFTHSVSKAREYYGLPRIVAECKELNFKAVCTGYGFDMIGALMSDFINAECTQYAIEAVFAFNELRGDSYNPIRYNSKTQQFSVNLCIPDCVQLFEDCSLDCKLVSKKNGQITTCVISSK